MIKNIFKLFIITIVSCIGNIYSQPMLEKISDISLSPVKTFETQCSRCHGYEGNDYEKDFKDLSENKLKEVVEDMMFGPAFLNPTEIEVEAMTAYNMSIQDKMPFAVVLNAKSFLEGVDDSLKISVSPGSKISLEDEEKIKVKKEDEVWQIFYDRQKIKKLKIAVTRNDGALSFIFPDEIWTK